jgi:hypothetical protein
MKTHRSATSRRACTPGFDVLQDRCGVTFLLLAAAQSSGNLRRTARPNNRVAGIVAVV